MDYRRRLDEMEARLPKDVIWQLANGGEFRSAMTTAELVAAGFKELDGCGPHPILDAAMQTVRSNDGSRVHELFRAVAAPILAEQGTAYPVRSRNNSNAVTSAAFKAFERILPENCPN